MRNRHWPVGSIAKIGVVQSTTVRIMPQLLEFPSIKAFAQGLRASLRKLPYISGAGKLVPDKAGPMNSEPDQVAAENPMALEARVLEILRVARQIEAGPLRRDALTEVGRLRKRAIELHRRNAAELRAQIAARRPGGPPHLHSINETSSQSRDGQDASD